MKEADLLIVVGTSLQASPLYQLHQMAKKARKVIMNHQPTDLDHEFDLVLQGSIVTILGEIAIQLDQKAGRRSAKPLCQVCGVNAAEGVFSSRIAPVSYAFCQACLDQGAEAYDILVTKLSMELTAQSISPILERMIEVSLNVAGKSREQLDRDVYHLKSQKAVEERKKNGEAGSKDEPR